MQPDFIIQEDAASVLLKTRWMACYTLRDSYPGHASRCFESLDQRRRGQIIALFSRSDDEPSEQDITAAYNKIHCPGNRGLCADSPSKNGAETGLPSK